MKRSFLSALVLSAALAAGCANMGTTAPPDFPSVQKRLLSGIQSAQQASTATLEARKITPEDNKLRQQKLKAAYDAILAAKTPEQAKAEAEKVGVIAQ